MFTGIIEGLGTVTGIHPAGEGKRLSIRSDFSLEQSKAGDSISVSGACLTAVAIEGNRFEADVSPETIARTTFGKIKVGDRLNLERAMRLSDRLDGHLVTGHIDGTGVIRHTKVNDNAWVVTIDIPKPLLHYMIKKGSVAIDGISLTINMCNQERIAVTIIPHTARMTTIGFKKSGDRVNIETDMIGKYVERFVTTGSQGDGPKGADIDMDFLAKTGFI
jgi:riboflavin synthase